MPENLNDIVMGANAEDFLRNKKSLPGTWSIPEVEQARILSAGIRIAAIYSPASSFAAAKNPFVGMDTLALIVFDVTGFEAAKFVREEIIATLLHEIGHVLNRPKHVATYSSAERVAGYVRDMRRTQDSAGELEADDYARHCGYGMPIASALGKLATFNVYFANDLTRKRIARIESDEAMILHLP